ncbi:uncharacterized protein LOC116840727 isoform X2 [Odontomachus brunneus]|uniref:uncharacterized protein LOC116840727 isoform X2 n=1 Tax=Odontomachus brunneus TaxID=486640 RepID=UPI0013F206E9|nr:uncharacterized protein LOC116840727 isoform X2 [Odontomachus brunneus]XP_032663720.1 uncharacterized protein LOC116840727 isoform X2 [Odontomachus brunneus]
MENALFGWRKRTRPRRMCLESERATETSPESTQETADYTHNRRPRSSRNERGERIPCDYFDH